MKFIRKLFNKFARPSMYVTCMLTLAFVALGLFTIMSFLSGAATSGFILLFISALVFGYGMYAIIIQVLRLWPRLEKWSEGRRLINKFVMNYDFRSICTTLLVLVINLGFAIFNAAYGFMYQEWWCVSLFIYYLMLIVMRSSVSARGLTVSRRFDDTSREDAQLRVYRMAAIMMLVFTIALNFLLWELLSQEDFGFRKNVLLTVVTGIYTVIKVVMAVYNLIYTRGRHDKITHAIRNINMADALVSVMTLLMTLLTRFSDSYTAVTTVRVLGTIICIYVAAMALFMLINSVVKLKRNRRTLYEMLMDSLNEDFESSLEEPAWEALYATTEYAPVEYIVDSDFALGELHQSISDGGTDSLEATTGVHDSMLIPPDDLDPGFYKELYAMAGMSKPIPSAPSDEEDEPEEELEPTPLPSSLQPKEEPQELVPAPVHHDEEDDGFDDDMHGYVPVPDHPAAPAHAASSADIHEEEHIPVFLEDGLDEPSPDALQDSEDALADVPAEPSDETYSDSAEEEELIQDAEDALTEELAEETEANTEALPAAAETAPAIQEPAAETPADGPSCEAPADNAPADEIISADESPVEESITPAEELLDATDESADTSAAEPAEAEPTEAEPLDASSADNATEGTDAPAEDISGATEGAETPAGEANPEAEKQPGEGGPAEE